MMEIRIYSSEDGSRPFIEWLNALADRNSRAAISARLLRVELGKFGDCKTLRNGVMELRIDKGQGYRV